MKTKTGIWALVALVMPMMAAGSGVYTQLVWSDEFEVEGLPDGSKWGYDVGGWGWGNNELQYYTAERSENARVEGGYLVIEARKEVYENRNYTSARLLTQDKFEWQHGRIEARIKVPAGVGVWPAFWMLGSNFGEVNWPHCGEIDIMEFVGWAPKTVHGTMHGPGYSGGAGYGSSYDFAEDVSDNFHIFAVEWEPEMIRWYVDGILYHTAQPEDIYGTGRIPNPWVFEQPFFIILNIAIGGTFGGPVAPETVFPVQMLVDYVRVYEKSYGILDGYPQMGDWIDSGDFLGWVQVRDYPYIYIKDLNGFAHAGAPEQAGGQWLFIPRK